MSVDETGVSVAEPLDSSETGRTPTIDLSIGEFTGALGDSVTVFPIVVAVAALTELSLGRLLLGFAVFQVVWGLHYGLPMSVEPMKALAALVIAGSLTAGELAVAGLLVGGVLLVVGATGTLGRITPHVGRPVVRGVQLAVGLVLLETGVGLGLGDPRLALAATAVAVGVVLAGHRRASVLVVLGLGVAIAVAETGVPAPTVPAPVPSPTVRLPSTMAAVTSTSGAVGIGLPGREAVSVAAVGGTVAQLAMTVGNAAVATSLLLADYYDADVPPDELATSMGVTNLIAVPLGAMPMCHGSGGVAGKHAFGARTAGSNLVLGAAYALAAVAGVGVVAAFPLPTLGVVLALIAVELGRAGLDTDHLPLTVGIGILGAATNVGIAFVVGAVGYRILRRSDSTAGSAVDD